MRVYVPEFEHQKYCRLEVVPISETVTAKNSDMTEYHIAESPQDAQFWSILGYTDRGACDVLCDTETAGEAEEYACKIFETISFIERRFRRYARAQN
ncbi:hypothetical protein [Oryzomonas rubra]|uniref:Uncharacterized protein n=1 Tax=Oryzomonas rubra TaxID=2509454 RepID=A0A5A9X799_9BACT|nr:hypothetical protein [Oryzomonas rubra]KAA0888069.1 hypothetical protein ET418_16855 [Oryzomonas rubra]